uniref:Endothelin-converting enzyme 1 n=1 Tax=Solibacter usitatus (strain Ellin6076) TaxID=234267 RepID=Q023R5_SOLUE
MTLMRARLSRPRAAAILLAAGLVAAAGCRTTPPSSAAGIDLKGMDTSIAPGDDFNAYANGAWIKATPIPADKPGYGAGAILIDETRKRLQTLLQESSSTTANSDARKIADYYSTFMDEAAIESKGIAPLKPQLDEIAAIADPHGLARVLGSGLRADVDPLNNTNFETGNLFGVWITQGLTDPSHNFPYLLQGGLGLPDRDYYISASPTMAALRTQYQAHIAATFKLAGFTDPTARAARVFALETKMAQVHATRVESEDVHAAVSWNRDELTAKAPGLDWPALRDAAGLRDAPVFVIWHPKAIRGLAALAAAEPLDAWKDWLAFHAIEDAAAYLPRAFVEEHFAFYGKALNGTPEMRPRSQRAMDFTSEALGEVVGKAYVQRYFPAASKAKAQAMVDDLVQAFARRIDALSWMSPETKTKARQKLDTLKVGVGYPDQWQDYSALEIVKGDAFGNTERAGLFEYHRHLAKLHQPVDRGEWWMTPQTVNAVNLPLQNALNFPAAIIQPPYFDPDADAAHNYGSMGAIIGHEISHSFDDQGSLFDASGRLANWWTKADFDHFKAAGEALAAQFDAYRPFPDLAVNGHQTLSENIADVAGLLAAYDAYRLSLHGQPDVVKAGFTGDQRFMISFAQSWRARTRDAALRRQIATDGHAPAEYRALAVRNLDAWYDAFSVRLQQKLYLAPPDRVHVW